MLQITLIEDSVNTSSFDDILRGWHTLCKPLGTTDSISWCIALLNYELANGNREFIVNRIISRIIKLGTIAVRRWIHAKIRANR